MPRAFQGGGSAGSVEVVAPVPARGAGPHPGDTSENSPMAPPPHAASGAAPAALVSVRGSHSEGHGTTAGGSGGNNSPSVGSSEGKIRTKGGIHDVEAGTAGASSVSGSEIGRASSGSGDSVGRSSTATAKSADVEECKVAIGPGVSSHPALLVRDQPTRPAGVTGDPRSSPISAVPAAATGASAPASAPPSTAEIGAEPTAAKTFAATTLTSSAHPTGNPASAVGSPCSFPIKTEGGTTQPQGGGNPSSNSSASQGSAPVSNYATNAGLAPPASSRVLDAMASAAISVASAGGGASSGKNPGEACNASRAPAPGPATTSGTAMVILGQQTVPVSTAHQPNPTSGSTLQQPSASTAVTTPQTLLPSTVIQGTVTTATTSTTSTTSEVNAVPNNAAAVSRPVSPLSHPPVNTTLAHGAGGSPASPPMPSVSASATGVTAGTPMPQGRPLPVQQTYDVRGTPASPCARVQPLGRGFSAQSQPQLTTVPGTACLVASSVSAVSTSAATVSVVAAPAAGMRVVPALMNTTVAGAGGQQPPRAPAIGSAVIPTTIRPQVHAQPLAHDAAGRSIVPVGDRGVAAPGTATVVTSPAPVHHARNYPQHHPQHHAGAVISQPQMSGRGGVPPVPGGRAPAPATGAGAPSPTAVGAVTAASQPYVVGAGSHGGAGGGGVYGAGATPPRGAVITGRCGVAGSRAFTSSPAIAATTGAPSPTPSSHHQPPTSHHQPPTSHHQPPTSYPRPIVRGATSQVIPTHRMGMHDIVGGARLGSGLQVNGIGASGGVPGAGGEVDEVAPIKENTGRWTHDEHRLFLRGLELHGKGWKKIASLIKTRTVVQIRTHAQKYFQKMAKARGPDGVAPDDSKLRPPKRTRRHRSFLELLSKAMTAVAPSLQPYVVGEGAVEKGLYLFLSPMTIEVGQPDQAGQAVQDVERLSAAASGAGAGGEGGGAAGASGGGGGTSASPGGQATKSTAAVQPPHWYSAGRGVDDLLHQAEGLDWLSDSGSGGASASAAAAAAAASRQTPAASAPGLVRHSGVPAATPVPRTLEGPAPGGPVASRGPGGTTSIFSSHSSDASLKRPRVIGSTGVAAGPQVVTAMQSTLAAAPSSVAPAQPQAHPRPVGPSTAAPAAAGCNTPMPAPGGSSYPSGTSVGVTRSPSITGEKSLSPPLLRPPSTAVDHGAKSLGTGFPHPAAVRSNAPPDNVGSNKLRTSSPMIPAPDAVEACTGELSAAPPPGITGTVPTNEYVQETGGAVQSAPPLSEENRGNPSGQKGQTVIVSTSTASAPPGPLISTGAIRGERRDPVPGTAGLTGALAPPAPTLIPQAQGRVTAEEQAVDLSPGLGDSDDGDGHLSGLSDLEDLIEEQELTGRSPFGMGENAEAAIRRANAPSDGGAESLRPFERTAAQGDSSAAEGHAAQQPHGQRGGSGAHEEGLDDEDAFVAALLDP